MMQAASPAVPPGRRISSGNGSPSAHTAPSSKYSFFQIGTVFFSVSMIQRQASNASDGAMASSPGASWA